MGSKTKIVHQLNKSCMIAAVKPDLYSSKRDFEVENFIDIIFLPILFRLVKEIMEEVIEVPTLLPMITGIPCLMVIISLAAMATTTELIADED